MASQCSEVTGDGRHHWEAIANPVDQFIAEPISYIRIIKLLEKINVLTVLL